MLNRLGPSILSLILLSVLSLKADSVNAELRTRGAQKTLQLIVEGEDPVMVELFGKELQDLLTRSGASVTLVDKETKPYDFRIIFTSGVGTKTDSCTGSCSTVDCRHTSSSSSYSCYVTITLYFTSAVVLKPDGMVHAADTGMGINPAEARNLLARRLVSRL